MVLKMKGLRTETNWFYCCSCIGAAPRGVPSLSYQQVAAGLVIDGDDCLGTRLPMTGCLSDCFKFLCWLWLPCHLIQARLAGVDKILLALFIVWATDSRTTTFVGSQFGRKNSAKSITLTRLLRGETSGDCCAI